MKTMKSRGPALAAVSACAILLAGGAAAQQKEVVIGEQCDRTGVTQIVGVNLCPGIMDYVNLINSKGGVEGYKIKLDEIDNEYKVPPAIEAYERQKQLGAISTMMFGTPQTLALTQKLNEDRIPGTSPGFGSSAAANGTRYPYVFPVAASYWSQSAAAVKFIKDRLGGLEGKKIAYLFYDNPAGHEPMVILEELQKQEKFELKTFAVPPPGVEMGAQVLDISQRYRPDFVIAHLFGRSPSVAIKELKRAGYPLSKVIGMVWASAEADIEAAGGWAVAEGYHTIQFAGVGEDYPVHGEIVAMYKAEGKEPPKAIHSTVYYNRGVLEAALHVEAIRNAIKAKGGGMPTGEDVKKGFEQIHGFTLGGLVPPMELSATDHEGGGWVQIFQVKGGKFVKETDWFRGYPEVLAKQLKSE
ncbi:MAG: ABC transporter substrate-binding protein [Xanthobacteraceae bacterium]|jgi:branched-chain amino acid transport system substrate-binding protein